MASLFSQDEIKIPDAMESRYQKYLVRVCLLIGIPVLGYFMIYDFIIGRYLVAVVLASMSLILLGLFLITKKSDYKATENQIYKSYITCFFILFGFYLTYSIGFEGNIDRMPWAFLFATLVFFAFGATKGIIWTSVLYGILLLCELTIPSDNLPTQGIKIRFYLVLPLMIIATFFFERLKKKYQLQLINHQQSSQEPEYRYRQAFEQLKEEINSRQQAEKEFHQIENLFREMAYNIREVFWLFDWIEQKVIYVSPAYETIWGRSVEDLYHRYEEWSESIYPDDVEYANESFQAIAQTGGGKIREYRIVRPDGSVRWISDRGFTIKDDSEKVVRIAGIAEDITDRKQADMALRESEERFRELAELMPETIFEMDLDGNLTYVNRNAFNYFGYTRSDLKNGLKNLDMLIPKDRERAAENTAKILEGEKTGINEYTALRKDGSTFPVMVHSAPIIRQGQPAGLRGFIIDITDRKKAEEERHKLEVQFQQAQRFEALGTLAGGIAHDFNNLLMNIQGNTSLMLCEIKKSHPYYNMLKNIEKQVKSGAQLTRQMLGYARKGKFNVKAIELNKVVNESAETFGRTRKEITIQRDFADELYAVEADRGQIEQVLLNLYVNAADAMPGGGLLQLKTRNVSHSNIKSDQYKPQPGNYVQLTISDSGIGMDQHTLEHIFDPFFTTKEMGRGTGLGLASVYGIIKSHDGYIDVTSEKGQGTTFTIFLPATHKSVEDQVGAAAELIRGNGTLLVVDDEALVLDVAANMLEKLGYTALKAQNGNDAVNIFKAHKDEIKMVVLDIIMPNMGGSDVYDKIKMINPDVKVMLSSGYSVDGQAIELLERGCDGFLQKPFTMEELSGKVEQILNR
jgi:PAS domain S-box-containing protein